MVDDKHWLEPIQAEYLACFKGDLVLSLPEGSYTAEEMWGYDAEFQHVAKRHLFELLATPIDLLR